MANENKYNGGASATETKRYTDTDLLTYNLLGRSITSATFEIKKDEVLSEFTKIASEALNDGDPRNDVIEVRLVKQPDGTKYDETLKRNVPAYRPELQVVIPARNKNLIGGAQGNIFVKAEEIANYSDKLKQFINLYCDDRFKTVFVTPIKESDVPCRAIIVSISKVLSSFVDYDGRAFKTSRGINTYVKRMRTDIYANELRNGNGEVTDIVSWTITKSLVARKGVDKLVFNSYDTSEEYKKNKKHNKNQDEEIPDFRKKFK